MAEIRNVWETAESAPQDRPRKRILVNKEDDLLIALNRYQPGARNEFHYHKGTSQSFLCLKGTLTLRTMDAEDGPVTEHRLREGECALIPGGQYYQLHNETDAPVLLYQVKKPGDQIVVAGKGQLSNKDYFTEGRQKQTAL